MSTVASRSLTGLATLVVAVGLALGALSGHPELVVESLAVAVAVGVAWVVVRHDATTPVGPALAWSSACINLVGINDVLAASAYTDDPLPLAEVARHLWVGSWPVNLAGVFALLLVFPAGRRRGLPWAGLPWMYGAGTLGVVWAEWDSRQLNGRIVSDLSPAQVAVESVSLPLIAASLVMAVASLVVTYRRSGDLVREQVRWLMTAGAVVVLLMLAGWAAEAAGAVIEVAYTPFLLAIVVLVPLAVGVAIVRHDLFDIDRLLSATTAWALTLIVSAALFGLVVLGTSQLVHEHAAIGSTAAAFVTALALLPLHGFMADLVGRVVDRDSFVAVTAIERFTTDVRSGRREPEEVEAALRDAMRDPGLRVVLARPDGTWAGIDGHPVPDPHGVDLSAAGRRVACVELTHDTARSRRRMTDLARAAWVPIEVSRLRLALREALEETRASRARIAEASAAERRRIERDLHDGAQQRLVATGMRLRLLQRELAGDRAREVDAAVDELQATVDELRHLANDVRPSRLDDGLGPALQSLRDSCPLPLDLTVPTLPPLDEMRSFTAYLVVAEAVTNALKHANASSITVSVSADGDRLALEVRDDGIGGIPSGASLTALRDRILSVGGTLAVDSPDGLGTTVRAVI